MTNSKQINTSSSENDILPKNTPMVEIDHVSMIFNIANQKLNNLKELTIAIAKREFFFKEFTALDDIDFVVNKGDVFGILGSNGSGKSTLLKIIAGVLEPTKGTVRINGNIAPLIELGAGFDFELTARENIYLNGALLGYSRNFISEHFDEIVEFAEISDFLDMPIKNYSSGMVARIAFAIATIMIPDILIVDEVLSVGDFMFQQKCERRIQTLINEYGTTVLIVSHNNDQIQRLCNKAAWIEKGAMKAIGEAQEVCELYRLLSGHCEDLFSVEVISETYHLPAPNEAFSTSTIFSDDRFQCATLIDQMIYKDMCEEVVISLGQNSTSSLIASNLANILDAPILFTKGDTLPDSTMYALRLYMPKKIIVLNEDSEIEPQTIQIIQQLCPNSVLSQIESTSCSDLSISTYKSKSNWGKTAVVSWSGGIGDIISLMPFSYRERMCLLINPDDGKMSTDIASILLNDGFDRVILLGGQEIFPADDERLLHENGINVIRFCGKDAYDANEMINRWIISQPDSTAAYDSLIISSIWHPECLLPIGKYSATTDSLILLMDSQNLDSVARGILYIKSRKGEIKHLTFLGDDSNLSKIEQELFAKVASSTKIS